MAGLDFPQGTYDPNTYVDTNPATYPMPATGPQIYQPGMWWTATVDSVVGPAPPGFIKVKAGDRIYPVGPGGILGRDWAPLDTGWIGGYHGLTLTGGRFVGPMPYTGCLIAPDRPELDGGHSVVVDVFYDALEGVRLFGDATFGADVFGGNTPAGKSWHLLEGHTAINLMIGDTTATPHVPVNRCVVDFNDAGDVFDFASPGMWHRPFAGDLIRVGAFTPAQLYYPLFTGYIDRIDDVHDTPHRTVTVEAFGLDTDLSVHHPQWRGLGIEPAMTRLRNMLYNIPQTAVWVNYIRTGPMGYTDVTLVPDAAPHDINVRAEVDRLADAAGWIIDVDRWGYLQVNNWPHTGFQPWVYVSDCPDQAPNPPTGGYRLSTAIRYVADRSQVLNHAELADEGSPPQNAIAEIGGSVTRWGLHDSNYGFPRTGLAYQSVADAQARAQRAVDRYGYIIRHIESVYADSLADPAWMAQLAVIQPGQLIRVARVWPELDPLTLDGVVCGIAHRITRGRWEAQIYTATYTPTL